MKDKSHVLGEFIVCIRIYFTMDGEDIPRCT